jgi:hypothetical protein
MRRQNATSPPPARRSRARRAPAALAILSLVFPGCAVHSFQPVADAEVGHLAASAVRVAGDRGTVELASTRVAYPYLTGRLIKGDGPVQVDVPQGARVGILRCAGARDQGRVLWVAGRDPSRLVGCDVRIETAQGSVALRVQGASGADGLFGDALPCRDERGRCTGLVRVDLRQYEGVEMLQRDVPLSVAAALGAAFLVAYGLFYLFAAAALSHLE